VVLLSGGIDSTTTVAIAKAEGFQVYALSFRYGQRHVMELLAAQNIAAQFCVAAHDIIDIDLRRFGGSALTDNIAVPKNRPKGEMSGSIPVTYVPARNTIFLAFSLAWAEVLGSFDIFLGVNAIDYSGYPDCRPEYIEAFERMGRLATKVGTEGDGVLKVHTPLIRLSKKEIIQKGLSLGVDYSFTTSCYDPSPRGEACGKCDSCQLRLDGFRAVGIRDPIRYAG